MSRRQFALILYSGGEASLTNISIINDFEIVRSFHNFLTSSQSSGGFLA